MAAHHLRQGHLKSGEPVLGENLPSPIPVARACRPWAGGEADSTTERFLQAWTVLLDLDAPQNSRLSPSSLPLTFTCQTSLHRCNLIMAFTKFNHKLAKRVFGIDLNESQHRRLHEFEVPLSHHVPHAYREQEPTVAEWFRSLAPSRHGTVDYVHDLFPSAQWVARYNLRWLLGDSIAGLTIGLVIVPQAMAYALLAQLSPEYGLYTSFVGAATYWLFGTSKDIVIGVSTPCHAAVKY